jgi:hypothetical protein
MRKPVLGFFSLLLMVSIALNASASPSDQPVRLPMHYRLFTPQALAVQPPSMRAGGFDTACRVWKLLISESAAELVGLLGPGPRERRHNSGIPPGELPNQSQPSAMRKKVESYLRNHPTLKGKAGQFSDQDLDRIAASADSLKDVLSEHSIRLSNRQLQEAVVRLRALLSASEDTEDNKLKKSIFVIDLASHRDIDGIMALRHQFYLAHIQSRGEGRQRLSRNDFEHIVDGDEFFFTSPYIGRTQLLGTKRCFVARKGQEVIGYLIVGRDLTQSVGFIDEGVIHERHRQDPWLADRGMRVGLRWLMMQPEVVQINIDNTDAELYMGRYLSRYGFRQRTDTHLPGHTFYSLELKDREIPLPHVSSADVSPQLAARLRLQQTPTRGSGSNAQLVMAESGEGDWLVNRFGRKGFMPGADLPVKVRPTFVDKNSPQGSAELKDPFRGLESFGVVWRRLAEGPTGSPFDLSVLLTNVEPEIREALDKYRLRLRQMSVRQLALEFSARAGQEPRHFFEYLGDDKSLAAWLRNDRNLHNTLGKVGQAIYDQSYKYKWSSQDKQKTLAELTDAFQNAALILEILDRWKQTSSAAEVPHSFEQLWNELPNRPPLPVDESDLITEARAPLLEHIHDRGYLKDLIAAVASDPVLATLAQIFYQRVAAAYEPIAGELEELTGNDSLSAEQFKHAAQLLVGFIGELMKAIHFLESEVNGAPLLHLRAFLKNETLNRYGGIDAAVFRLGNHVVPGEELAKLLQLQVPKLVAALEAQRLAAYGLPIDDNTPFSRHFSRGPAKAA